MSIEGETILGQRNSIAMANCRHGERRYITNPLRLCLRQHTASTNSQQWATLQEAKGIKEEHDEIAN